MRVPSYRQGRLLRHRAFIRLTRAVGPELDDVGKAVMRRPALFGRPFLAVAQNALRGASVWSVGARELFGAVVSAANSCRFCVGTHGAIAEQLLGDHVGWEDGRFGPQVTAAARFAHELTTDAPGVEDALAAARAAGVDDDALEQVVQIVFLFSFINRVTDALGFEHRSDDERVRGAAFLRKNGYRLPGPLMV
jgi:uncharacterized peroxidase-related enzyme